MDKIKNIILAFVLALVLFTVVALSPDQQINRPYDFYFEVAVGNVLNHTGLNKYGRNPDVDSGAQEDIWDGGGTWNEPSAAQVYTITSTSTNDKTGGSGARTMTIYGLDSTGAEINETVSLTGTTVLTAVNEYSMIYRMVVNTAGSGGVNAGIITANAVDDANVTAQINAGNNQTLMAVYKVPLNKQGCLTDFYGSLNRATGANTTGNIRLYAKPTGEVWQLKNIIGVASTGASSVRDDWKPPSCFPALTLLKMASDVSNDNSDVSAGFDLILRPD